MDIGDWVHFPYNGEKITGFVVAVTEADLTVQVTIPNSNKSIEIPRAEVVKGCSALWLDDIPTMIDLALVIKDKQWFEKWMSELSLWRPVQSAKAP